MARPKRSSAVLQKAEKREAGLHAISPTLDLGNDLTLALYSADIQTLRAQIANYNRALSDLDALARQIKQTEQRVRDRSEHMLLGVAAKYGTNSSEYGKAGGTPRSERRRSTQKSTRQQPAAIGPSLRPTTPDSPAPAFANGNAPAFVNGNGNGNGKALVS